jgi:uncharacterized membrane protein YphA (DoxX/SURF4 family)
MTTATIGRSPANDRTSRSVSRHIPSVARVLMGLVFFVFGLNGFLHFIPQPPPPQPAMAFFGALAATGYMLPLVMGTQLLVGVLLLSNRFVPLALALIAPIIVNIVAFHIALAPSGLPLALIVLVLELVLAWSYRERFRPMLVQRVVPRGVSNAGS